MEEQIKTQKALTRDEKVVKETILSIYDWWRYLYFKWPIIVLFSILGASIGVTWAFFQKPTYIAKLTFALEEEKAGGNIAGALGIASSLGIDLGGTATSGAFNGSNLIELMKSRNLVQRALLNPVQSGNKKESLADYYLDISGMKEKWQKNADLKDIHFPFDSSLNNSHLLRIQDSILGVLYNKIAIGKNNILTVSQTDKKVSIISVEVRSEDELFSQKFAETLAKVVSEFYIDTKSKKARLNFEILQKQTDSIRNDLNDAIMGVAVANDNTYNLNPALNVHRTPSVRKQVDVQANTAILTQLVANLEMAKVSLRKETPLIQIIDTPILPLKKEKMGKLKSLIIGGILSAFGAVLFLVFKRMYDKVMFGKS